MSLARRAHPLVRLLGAALCLSAGACAPYAFDSGFYDSVVRVEVAECTLDEPPESAEGIATVRVAQGAREATIDAPLPPLAVLFVRAERSLVGDVLEERVTSSSTVSAAVGAAPIEPSCRTDAVATRVLELVEEREDGMRLVGHQDTRVDAVGEGPTCVSRRCSADVELTLTLRGRCPAECIVGDPRGREPLACACPREALAAPFAAAP